MTYALRLPPHLDASARAHAAYLGISFNAFLCIAVEGYLRDYPPSRHDLGRHDPAAPVEGPSKPATGGKLAKKETFKDRQRARDTAFKGSKA
jgi:hypothetical protein